MASASSSDASNGSFIVRGPGRQEMYCHGSPHVHALSTDAASSMRNWIYPAMQEWLPDFCCRRMTVCMWANILGTMSAAFFLQRCNISSEAPDPHEYICDTSLNLLLRLGLELAEGADEALL